MNAPRTVAIDLRARRAYPWMGGIVLAILGYKVFDLLTPFDLEREMCEKQNMAVAVLCGAMVLGICLIVAAAVL